MLPELLHGPDKTIRSEPYEYFLENAQRAYPHLDKDFLLQICFEHPTRFNRIFPGFDIERHTVKRIKKRTEWVASNIRYDGGERLEGFWVHHFGKPTPLLEEMLRNKTWPFPPVVVEANMAADQLSAKSRLGEPYYLIEGTHRVSYLLNMAERGIIDGNSEHELLEIVNKNIT